MAFDSIGKGVASGLKWRGEMNLRWQQLQDKRRKDEADEQFRRDQLAQQRDLENQRVQAQYDLQGNRLAAESAEREADRQLRSDLSDLEREERGRQFDLSRGDKLEQQDVENRRRATLDEWQMRLDEQKMQAEDARLAEIQERVAGLIRQNDEAIRQDEEKKRLYEQVPMEALFSALETKKPDGSSTGFNLPGVNAALAEQLGLKEVAYSGFDENGIFVIKGTDEAGKQFVKQYSPEWVQGACEWRYGKDSPFAKAMGERAKGEQEVSTYRRKKAIDQENYEKNKGEANLQSVLRSLSVEVGKGNMTQEEAEQAFAFYQQQAAKGAQGRSDGTPATAPQKGGAEGQDELAALLAERERRAAARRGQRNIPGMPRRQQEQPAPAQTQDQSAPQGEEAAAEPAQGKDRAAAIAQLAKDTGLDEGHAERAYNIALSQYKASQRRGGNRSFESFLNSQATWMMTHGRQGRGRTGRR